MPSTALQNLLDSEGIRHFRAQELTLQRQWGEHVEPPERYLQRIVPTVILADEIREKLGAPIRVSSGYRTPDYNRHVGGSPASEHIQFRALDLQPHDPALMETMRAIAIRAVDQARARGWNVALIHYDTFIHIDVGSTRRHNLDLDNRKRSI